MNEHVQQQLFGERHRPELSVALDYIRAGDTLVVWKLDHLARSMRQLIETIEDLHARSPRASTPPHRVGGWCSTSSARLNEFERALIRERTSAGLQVHGPERWMGKPGQPEPGLLSTLVHVVTALLLWLWMQRSSTRPD